jgi:hypothetical protein
MIGERTRRLYTEPVDAAHGDPGKLDHREHDGVLPLSAERPCRPPCGAVEAHAANSRRTQTVLMIRARRPSLWNGSSAIKRVWFDS